MRKDFARGGPPGGPGRPGGRRAGRAGSGGRAGLRRASAGLPEAPRSSVPTATVADYPGLAGKD